VTALPARLRYIAKVLEALEQLGWVHGRNVQIDYRGRHPDRTHVQSSDVPASERLCALD
jgi:hypothetical protein